LTLLATVAEGITTANDNERSVDSYGGGSTANGTCQHQWLPRKSGAGAEPPLFQDSGLTFQVCIKKGVCVAIFSINCPPALKTHDWTTQCEAGLQYRTKIPKKIISTALGTILFIHKHTFFGKDGGIGLK